MSPIPTVALWLASSDDAAKCNLVVANDGANTLWHLLIPINEISLDLFNIDDTHMSAEDRLPWIKLRRLDAGERAVLEQAWGLAGIERASGDCWVDFSEDEQDSVRRTVKVAWAVSTRPI